VAAGCPQGTGVHKAGKAVHGYCDVCPEGRLRALATGQVDSVADDANTWKEGVVLACRAAAGRGWVDIGNHEIAAAEADTGAVPCLSGHAACRFDVADSAARLTCRYSTIMYAATNAEYQATCRYFLVTSTASCKRQRTRQSGQDVHHVHSSYCTS
jgi:hypothetical protein